MMLVNSKVELKTTKLREMLEKYYSLNFSILLFETAIKSFLRPTSCCPHNADMFPRTLELYIGCNLRKSNPQNILEVPQKVICRTTCWIYFCEMSIKIGVVSIILFV